MTTLRNSIFLPFALLVLSFLAQTQSAAQMKPFVSAPPSSGIPPVALSSSTTAGQSTTDWGVLSVNNLWSWQKSDGSGNRSPSSQNGLSFPAFTGTAVYQDNLVFGAKLFTQGFPESGGIAPVLQPIRVSGATYFQGMEPGRYLGESPVPGDPIARVYRIRRAYASLSDAELSRDARIVNELGESEEVSPTEKQALIDQYALDWAEWPVGHGAPYIERNGIPGYQAPPAFGASFSVDSLISGRYDEPGVTGSDPNLPADQVLYMVYHGMNRALSLSFAGSEPMGVEVQKTVWAYDRQDALGNVYFMRYRLVNLGVPVDIGGGQTAEPYLDSLYVCQWSDVDLGYDQDDLLGCDTLLNLGYVYNYWQTDREYDPFGVVPPSCGYLLLGGALVDAPGDSGVIDLKRVAGKTNQPMTSFEYFATGSPYSDPPFGDYGLGSGRWWKLLRGFVGGGDFPSADELYWAPYGMPRTKFPFYGDPTLPASGVNFIDGASWGTVEYSPSDRRLMVNSGPTRLAPGEHAEYYFAFVGAVGADRISSVVLMKATAALAQEEFESLFSGSVPRVRAVALPGPMTTEVHVKARIAHVDEATGVSAELAEEEAPANITTTLELYDDGLHGDGLAADDLWAGEATVSNTTKLHRLNLVVTSSQGSRRYEKAASGVLLRPLPTLTNLTVTWEDGQQDNAPNPGEDFRVGFSVKNHDSANPVGSLMFVEDGPFSMTNIPPGATIQSPSDIYRRAASGGDSTEIDVKVAVDGVHTMLHARLPLVGWSPTALWRDTLSVIIIKGMEQNVFPIIADPNLLTSHTYAISFRGNGEDARWSLWDKTLGAELLVDQIPLGPEESGAPVVDGIQFVVRGQSMRFTQFLCVANGGGVLAPPEQGCFAFNANGFPFFNSSDRPSDLQQLGLGHWGIHTGTTSSNDGTFSYFNSRVTQNGDRWPFIFPYDYEIRFTPAGGIGFEPSVFLTGAGTGGTVISVPFELWNIGIGTPDDPSDDYRLFPYLLDSEANGEFSLAPIDHPVSGGDNDPETDWVYWVPPADASPGQSGYDAIVADVQANSGATHQYLSAAVTVGIEIMRRMVLVNWNGGSVSDSTFPANVNQVLPETGTVFRILTTKEPRDGDSLVILAPTAIERNVSVPTTYALDQNYPNPFNPTTTIRFSIATKEHATLRVYDLLGRRIQTLVDDELEAGSHRITWEPKGIASGVYIYRLEAGTYHQARRLLLVR